jgi:hypothetical protein
MGTVQGQSGGLSNAVAAIMMAGMATAFSLLLANTTSSRPQEKASAEPKALVVGAKTPISDSKHSDASNDVSTPRTESSNAHVLQATALDMNANTKFTVSEPRLDATAKPALQDYAVASKPLTSDTTPSQPAKGKEYLPTGAGLPTPVAIKNSGGSSAPVQRVEFVISKPFKTPTRDSSTAKVEGIPVAFGESNYDAKSDKFSVSLTAPQVAPVPNQPIPLAVAIVWPKFAGWSYRGKLTVYQAGQQPTTVDNVEVDIAKAAAK